MNHVKIIAVFELLLITDKFKERELFYHLKKNMHHFHDQFI